MRGAHLRTSMDGVPPALMTVDLTRLGLIVDMETLMEMNVTILFTTVVPHIMNVLVPQEVNGVLLVSTNQPMITIHTNTVMLLTWVQTVQLLARHLMEMIVFP